LTSDPSGAASGSAVPPGEPSPGPAPEEPAAGSPASDSPISENSTSDEPVVDGSAADAPAETALARRPEEEVFEPVAGLKERSEAAPIIDLVDLVVKSAIKSRASDIHVEPMEKGVLIRHRLDGALVHDDRQARLPADDALRRLLQRLQMMLDQPVTRKRVGCADLEVIAFDGEQAAGTHPLIDDRGGELVGHGVEEATPKAIQHRSSPHLRTELSTGVDSVGRLVR